MYTTIVGTTYIETYSFYCRHLTGNGYEQCGG